MSLTTHKHLEESSVEHCLVADNSGEVSPVCGSCDGDLLPHNTTGICAECRHIERDRGAGYTAEEVTLDEARANFMAVFAGLYRPHVDVIYGVTCRCGRFRARRDTGKCEWCSGPRRFPAKRTKKPRRTNA